MARRIDFFSPTMRMQRQRVRGETEEGLTRMGALAGARYHPGHGYRYKGRWYTSLDEIPFERGAGREFGGAEFGEARDIYRELGATPAVTDVSGETDLNAAELSALIEAREGISEQGEMAGRELRETVGRLGGGGSEAIEAQRGLETGIMGARVQALRDVLGRAQGTREEAKRRRLTARTAAGAGLSGLASLRETGRQFDINDLRAQMQARMNMLGGGVSLGVPGGGGGDRSLFPAGGQFTKFTTPQQTSARLAAGAFRPPTMYNPRGRWL